LKSLSVFIVEDEPLITATIELALRKQNFIVAGSAEDFTSALKDIELHKPDLVLIDIQLEGSKDGVDLAVELDKKNYPYLYLSSQTDPITIDRVKFTNPLGYIVKPFTENGLRTNIELAWYKYKEAQQYFITLKHEGRLHRINENTISYLKAYDNYCYVITATNTFLVPQTLKHVSGQLKSPKFIKAHRSYVVNIEHITGVDKNNLLLVNETIPISASQKKTVIDKLKNL